MSDNIFARTTAHGPLRRVATGFGMAVAAYAMVGLGTGAAAAAPQQPFAADDPIPGLPGGAGGAVNIANSLFGSLSGLMNNVFPGAGDKPEDYVMAADDVAQVAVLMAALPSEVNLYEATILPNHARSFIGRG